MQNDGFYKGLIDNLTEGIYFLDRERYITYWNRGAERLTGYPAQEVLGRCCADGLLQHMDPEGRLLCHDGCPMEAAMTDGREREAELFLHHRAGHRVPITVRAVPIRGTGGEIVGAVEVFNDISRQVLAEDRVRELEAQSLLDPLTGAGTRRYAEISLTSRLSERKRYGLPVGLLFVDVDRFKSVNDRFGHAAGDEALRVVGRTLAAALRAGDFLGRWGGEEFIVLIGGLEGKRLRDAADRLRSLIGQSSVPSVPGLGVTVSIGVTGARSDDSLDSLVARADGRMYEAKRRGRNRVFDDFDAGKG
ncbi:MAG TPA: sensor domain-containing diguanylate cyclase [Thermoanaerobaculia bacterium]|nr:sensor domain-containing diguanylate cyclase [Thermoanaerobaculia bacterium]